MKNYLALILFLIFCKATTAQILMDKYTVEGFTVSLPFYMSKTGGLNPDASIQFRNMVKDVSGYVVKEEKSVKLFDDPANQEISQFYDQFVKDFLTTDFSYLDDETMIYYFHLIGIVETKNAFYKVVCSSSLDDKKLFKSDFQKIVYSIKD